MIRLGVGILLLDTGQCVGVGDSCCVCVTASGIIVVTVGIMVALTVAETGYRPGLCFAAVLST